MLLIGFSDALAMGDERAKDDLKGFGLSNVKDGDSTL